jgi:FkbM family methyltransferase
LQCSAAGRRIRAADTEGSRWVNSGAGMAEKIIYDFGANNGDDVPYYLLKADRVVAVEANPVLAEEIERRFSREISSGRLVVENCVLTVDASAGEVPFYLHKSNHVLSQFPAPQPSYAGQFDEVLLPANDVLDIVRRHGAPHYIKIDVEHFDHVILRRLLLNNIRPPYISAESHSVDTLCLLVALGEYSAFKLVDGASVATRYARHTIDTADGARDYSFVEHSAGPFGNDIAGSWMTKDILFRVLSYAGLGWKDIHASSVDAPDLDFSPQPYINIGIKY